MGWGGEGKAKGMGWVAGDGEGLLNRDGMSREVPKNMEWDWTERDI